MMEMIRRLITLLKQSGFARLVAALFIGGLILSLSLVYFRSSLITPLNHFAQFIKDHGVFGVLLYLLLISLACFPPIIGYGLLLTISGFIFGLPLGFAVNFTGGLLGSSACFATSRWIGQRHKINGLLANESSNTRRSMEMGQQLLPSTTPRRHNGGSTTTPPDYQQPGGESDFLVDNTFRSGLPGSGGVYQRNSGSTIASAAKIVSSLSSSTSTASPLPPESSSRQSASKSKYGKLLLLLAVYLDNNPSETIKLLLMIRFAPYPFTIVNALLAQIYSVRYWQFALVTAISLLKTIIHAWIGSTVSNLQDLIVKSPAHDNGDGNGGLSAGTIVEIGMLVFAMVVSLVGGVYIYRLINRLLTSSTAAAAEEFEMFESAA